MSAPDTPVSGYTMRMAIKRIIFLICGWIVFILGVVGIFIPVLPTTPFLLLATYLFANSSPRFHTWIQSTGIYKRYVVPFKESGGIALGQKIRLLVISFVVMGISAWAVPRVYVWIVLAAVALWLLYLMFVRIPTVPRRTRGDEGPGDGEEQED